jgi:hypothetical protein
MRGFATVALACCVGVLVDRDGVAQADGDGWELRVPERVELVAGSSGALPIAIALDRGMSVSKDASVIVDLTPAPGLVIKRRRLGRGDAVDPDADDPRFAIPVRADTAGDYTLKLHMQFWLCGKRACRPIEARRTIAVAVSAPPVTP